MKPQVDDTIKVRFAVADLRLPELREAAAVSTSANSAKQNAKLSQK
jgi:hypothetical protein